jgi:hypothetical protein
LHWENGKGRSPSRVIYDRKESARLRSEERLATPAEYRHVLRAQQPKTIWLKSVEDSIRTSKSRPREAVKLQPHKVKRLPFREGSRLEKLYSLRQEGFHQLLGRFEHVAQDRHRVPQGAPTSPILANLAMREFDKLVSTICERHGLTYTIRRRPHPLDTTSLFLSEKGRKAIGEVYAAMGQFGLSSNATRGRSRAQSRIFVNRRNEKPPLRIGEFR